MSLELSLALLGAFASLVIPFILFAMRNQNDKINKMEERIFQIKGESVTKEEVRDLEKRISESLLPIRDDIKIIKELLLSNNYK